ncbi:MAG: molybdopterin molybdotransferase MoeA [Chlamydiota bacterium]|nr:molybdopterin molybdotransferase MoeA [Chlamydiota bacterium]
MLSIEEATDMIFACMPKRRQIRVKLHEALNHACAQDIISPVNIPAFSNSAMDGYVLNSHQLKTIGPDQALRLKCVANISAGSAWEGTIDTGICARIMTGAPIPKGADTVVMQEFVEFDKDIVTLRKGVQAGDNVRFLGEDVKKDERILEKGAFIRPQEIALLAACGLDQVEVYSLPRVAVISTGDELVEPGGVLKEGQIFESNSFSLLAQLSSIQIPGTRLGISRDCANEFRRFVHEGLKYDVLIISGGVSVGDYDLVKKVLIEEGVKEIFWKVAVKPGKPLFFGQYENTLVFGVPGNPVSSFVIFEVFIRPFLLCWTARERLERPLVQAVLEKNITKKEGRCYFIRAITEKKNGVFMTRPSGPQGSHQVKSLSRSNSFLIMPEHVNRLEKGQKIEVKMVDS